MRYPRAWIVPSLAVALLAGTSFAQEADAAPSTEPRKAAEATPTDAPETAPDAPSGEAAASPDAPSGPPPPAAPSGPPPPAGTSGEEGGDEEADEGPNRIQFLLGADLGEPFFRELTTILPGGSEALWSELQTQWAELEERYGFHPAKHLETAAVIGFGPIHKHVGGLALVVRGNFDRDRIHQALRASERFQDGAGEIVEEDGRTVYRSPRGASMRFMDEHTMLFLNGRLDERFFDLAGEGVPDPLDLEALRTHYGLAGTNMYLNVVVTPRQRRALAAAPGPLALVGPQAETLGVRVEDDRIQAGATFLSEKTAVQIEGMLQGGVQLAQARLADASQSLAAEKKEADFFELLSPARAGKTAAVSQVKGWLEGVKLSRAGTSVILELDRTKLPWLRLAKMVWIGGLAVPASQAIRRYRGLLMRSMRSRRGPSRSPFASPGGAPPPDGSIPVPEGR